MNTAAATLARPCITHRPPAAARAVLQLLARLSVGTLDLQRPDGGSERFGAADPNGREPHAAIHLADWSVCSAVLKSGDIGFAEAYIDGRWSTPDLVALLRLMLANREALESLVYGSGWGALLHRIRHLLRRNSRAGSRRNIHAHYDLGNDFYRLWLDETMGYSSAWFGGDRTQPLIDAQLAKVKRALQASGIQPGQRLLEIGCGWGSLAEIAARDHGAKVTGITLSTEQLDHGRRRLAAAGLDDKAQLRLQDYRDVSDAPFDAIVSIEMFEAVGREYWRDYFAALQRLLAPGGRACVQTIVIRDDLFERYARSTDFIQQYVFPGGMLPSRQTFQAEAERAGLQVVEGFGFGADYAETLRRWRAAFSAREAEVRRLGFDTRFVRTWDFYLAYCEAAFDSGNTDVVQFTLARR